MTPELVALIARAKNETSATEAIETTLGVAHIAQGEDPVRFLLHELSRQRDLIECYKDSFEREGRICDFVNENELARHLINGLGGEFILDNVFDFLQSLVLWHQDSLRESLERERIGLRKWCNDECRRRTGHDRAAR